MRYAAIPLILLSLAGCASSIVNEPSLARRPAEAIDPRVPVGGEVAAGPVDVGLSSRLRALVAVGREGARAFDAQVGKTETLANAAGQAQSESWIVAQAALSALEGSRGKTTGALADIDAVAAARINSQGGLSSADLAAVETASIELHAIADRQSETVTRIAAQLR